MLRLRVILATVTLLIACAGGSSIASASTVAAGGDSYWYLGTIGQGEGNHITVSEFTSGGARYYNFVEAGPATITGFGSPCLQSAPNVVFCPVVVGGVHFEADALTRDGNETTRITK